MTTYQGAGQPRPRGRRRLVIILIIVVVLLGLLVVLDFAAKAVAENKVASEIQSQGFPQKPDVSIEGFPFLTQVIGRNFHAVQITSHNLPEGPVTIKTINAVLNGVHVDSGFNGATVSQLTGTIMITFNELANALSNEVGPLGSLGGAGLTLSAAGTDEVKASLDLLITSGTATWQVTRLSGNRLHVRLISSSGLPAELLSSVRDITVALPSLPLDLKLQSVAVNGSGIIGTVTGQNVSFGG